MIRRRIYQELSHPANNLLGRALNAFTTGVFALLLSTITFAQASTSLQGTITDERGGKIVGAEVRLRSRAGAQLNTTTDKNGGFEFTGVQSGEYLIEVRASGFVSFTSDEIILERGQTKRVEFTLKVVGISETVVVTAAGTPERDAEVSKVVSILDSQQIEEKRELAVAEALRGLPGVRVQQQGSLGSLTSIRLRGLRTFDTA
ncbi:MAG TPA: hypothetical protein DCK99_04585, partial [Blastocatellia bacterium]|nr:hypothetical protein [Blastocatellia bacterium]